MMDISQNQSAEVTLFPPPSLTLRREDLDVSFEPLPLPPQPAVHAYRSKEINEWIGKSFHLFFFSCLVLVMEFFLLHV